MYQKIHHIRVRYLSASSTAHAVPLSPGERLGLAQRRIEFLR